MWPSIRHDDWPLFVRWFDRQFPPSSARSYLRHGVATSEKHERGVTRYGNAGAEPKIMLPHRVVRCSAPNASAQKEENPWGHGSGSFSRTEPNTSARTTYSRLQCPAEFVWIAEALGENPDVVRAAADALRAQAVSTWPGADYY